MQPDRSGVARRAGRQPQQARQDNSAALLELLLWLGPASQGEIAQRLGLTQGSVSRIAEPLLQAGLLAVEATSPTGPGRPRSLLRLNAAGRQAIGVHIGQNMVRVGLTDLSGACGVHREQRRAAGGPEATLRQVSRLIAEVAAEATTPLLGVGVAVGGGVDATSGTVLHNDALGWSKVEVAEPLADAVGLAVWADSHIRAQLGAELIFAGADASPNLLFVFVGNVAECGYLAPSAAGGHEVAQGSFASMLVPTLQRNGFAPFAECGLDDELLRAAVAAGLDAPSVPDLAALAETGDDAAAELLAGRTEQVVTVIRNLVDVLQPDSVVVGGGAAPGQRWLRSIQRRFATPHLTVRAPSHSESPLISSAAAIVVRRFVAAGGILPAAPAPQP